MNKIKFIDRDVQVCDSGDRNFRKRICIATPTIGNVRIEWALGRFGQIIPCNWSNSDIFQFFDHFAPLNYSVDDAQNICVKHAIDIGAEWLFLLEHDVLIPGNTFIKLNDYMREGKIPVVSGLYYAKSRYPEPLIYRGSGNGYFENWKFGDKVWVDGVPTGCLLIHMSLLRAMWDESEEYTANTTMGKMVVRRVFETPRKCWIDPEKGDFRKECGTSDLYWCRRVIEGGYFKKSGWTRYHGKKYPFLCDTSIFSQQIDDSGVCYPGPLYRTSKQWIGSPMEKEEKERMGYGKK